MLEIFNNISDSFKSRAKFIVDLAFQEKNSLAATKILLNFRNQISDDKKDFFDFYVNLRIEEEKNKCKN